MQFRRWSQDSTTGLVILLICLFFSTVQGQTKHTILSNGPAEKRINIVVLSEGYTTSQLSAFLADATNAVNRILSQPPYSDYKSFFNASAIAVASAQSGSDHPNWPQYRDTYFNSVFDETKNLITIPPNAVDGDYSHGRGKIDALLKRLAPQHDLVVLLVNDLVYGGSGGDVLIVSRHVAGDELVLHESGHTLAKLGDEYDTPLPGYPDVEEPNTTRETRRNFIKWKAWISPETPVPTPESGDFLNSVGLFEGAHYQSSGWYRPKLDCKMRTLGVPFCEVCSEALILSFYQKVRPIETLAPAVSVIALKTNESRTFSVKLASVENHAIQVQWFTNGVAVLDATGTTLTLAAADLRLGSNSVSIRVIDNTAAVRNDPENRLKQTVSWNVFVRQNDLFWLHADGRLAVWFLKGTNVVGSGLLQNGKPVGADWRFVGFGDFDRDGTKDILWQNQKTRQLAAWLMEGVEVKRSGLVAPERLASLDWQAIAMDDFNQDGHTDLLWRNNDGRLAVWLLNGTAFQNSVLLRGGKPVSDTWQFFGTGDFNGDGSTDLLWANPNRQLAAWLMDQTAFRSSIFLRDGAAYNPRWRFGGIGHVTGGETLDLFWHRDDGQLAFWRMQETAFQSSVSLDKRGSTWASGWRILGIR